MTNHASCEHTVSRTLADQLSLWGVEVVFGVAGDTILHFLDCLDEHPIRFVQFRHEENAAYAASAYSKLTGKLAVCISHGGPGVARLINGLADAKYDKCPVLAISGQVESKYMGTDYKQYINQQQLLSGVTIRSESLATEGSLIDVTTSLMRTALTQGGPVHLSIPKDLFSAELHSELCKAEPFLNQPHNAPSDVIDKGAMWIRGIERPLILIGIGATSVIDNVIELAERIGAGILYTLPLAGLIPRHPLVVGGIGEGGAEVSLRLLNECDGLIRIGATYWPPDFTPDQKKVLAIDREPTHISRGIPADFGILGDVNYTIPQLNKKIAKSVTRTGWRKHVEEQINLWQEYLAGQATENKSGWHPIFAVQGLAAAIPKNAIIALDVGDHVLWFDRFFRGQGQSVLVSGRWRGMGFSIGAGIAAQIAYPKRPVYVITGDGGFSMAMSDFVSAAEMDLPIVFIVFNNRSYAMEANTMKKSGLAPVGVSLRDIRFDEIARACGGVGYRVESKDLKVTLQEVQGTTKPVLIDLQIEPAMIRTGFQVAEMTK